MGEIFKLFGTIGINNGEANKSLDETEKKGQSVTGKLAGFFKKAAIAIATVFAIDKIIDFGKLSVEAAASAQALSAQFSQVFGKLEPLAQRTIEKMGKKMNILPNRIKPTFSKITSMFKGLGMATEAAMKKSEQATSLAADAAAFYDVSLEDASESLISFLKGNYEAGESVGIFANDTQMAQFAISKGIVSSTAEWQKLDEATKQATRLEYAQNMLDQAGAVGQAAREGDGYENVMGNLKQAWQDFLSVVGQPILGTVVSVIQQVTSKIQNLGDIFPSILSNLKKSFNSLRETSVFEEIATSFNMAKFNVTNAVKNMVDTVKEKAPGIQESFQNLLDEASPIFVKLASIIGMWVNSTVRFFQYTLPPALDMLKSGFDIFAKYIMPILNDTIDVIKYFSSEANWYFSTLQKPINDIEKTITQNKNTFEILKAVIVGVGAAFLTYKSIMLGIKVAQEMYNAVIFATTLVTKGLNAATVAMAGAQGASTLALKLNVAAVKAATIAQRAFNLVTKANPIMILITALVALAAAFVYLWKTNEDFRNKVIAIWNYVKEKAIEIFNAIADFLVGVWHDIVSSVTSFKNSVIEIWNSVKSTAIEIFSGISSFLSGVWNGIVTVAVAVWNVFYAVVGGIILSTINIIKGIFEGLGIYLGLFWAGIKAVALAIWGAIGTKVMAVIDGYINIWKTIFTGFASVLSGIWNSIMTIASAVWNLIQSTVTTIIQNWINVLTPIFQFFANTLSAIWTGIRNGASAAWNGIKTTITTIVQAVINTVVPIFNGMRNTISSIFNGIRNIASTVWNGIRNTVSSVVSGIVSVTTSLFNGMRNTISGIFNGIHSTISSIVNGVRNTISNVWSGLTGIVSGVFNGVRSAIEGPMNTAKNFISGIINSIKGFFNFSISWPKIPLPHFKINPSGWQIGDLLKGKIPSLGIDWYAKGGIFDKPTLFPGVNGRLSGVGEAGAEAVAPIDTLLGYVKQAVNEVVGDQPEGDINVTQYITSPEPLTPREIARETKLRLQDLATLKK